MEEKQVCFCLPFFTLQERLVASCEISDMKVVQDGPKGLQSFVTYHIRSEFTAGASHFCVRRYSDFEWLQKHLEAQFPDVLVPPIPEKDALCKETSVRPFLVQVDFTPKLESIQEEQFAAHKAANQGGKTEEEKPAQIGAAAASAFFSMLNTVSTLATNLTTEVEEVDTSFSDKQEYLKLLRERLEQTMHATENYLQLNTECIDQTVLLMKEVESFEMFERRDYPELSELFAKLRDVELGIALEQERKLKNEREMFEDALRDQVAWTVAAERLLNNRSDALKDYQIAQATTKAKQEKVDAGQGAEALALELQRAKDQEAVLKQAFEDMSATVKSQIEDYTADKSKQLRVALRELARENIELGEQNIALWKDLGRALDEEK